MDKEQNKLHKVPLTEALHGAEKSALARYREKASGQVGAYSFFWYELYHLVLASLGGALGYLTRKWAARLLLGRVGRSCILGRHVILRHPRRISLGDNVAVDDHVLLDASGSGEEGIRLGSGVIISRGCLVQGKLGPVKLADRVDVGCNTVFSSVAGIHVGEATIIAGNCYLGGGRYYHGRLAEPIMDQGGYSRGPIDIGRHSWLGAGAVILDGVRLGEGVIVGAGSVVTKDVPDYGVVAGVPARLLRIREEEQ